MRRPPVKPPIDDGFRASDFLIAFFIAGGIATLLLSLRECLR